MDASAQRRGLSAALSAGALPGLCFSSLWPSQGRGGRDSWESAEEEAILSRWYSSLSSIVIRRVTPDNRVVLRRLHGIEAMRFQGWDLGFWLDTEWQMVG